MTAVKQRMARLAPVTAPYEKIRGGIRGIADRHCTAAKPTRSTAAAASGVIEEGAVKPFCWPCAAPFGLNRAVLPTAR